MNHWWMMHGYGLYVWPAYVLVFGVFVFNVTRARARSKQVRRILNQWLHD
ncbi:MAG: heme exporter protein CcmD [Gammaproteobacteria bacterium]|nr:heme exporter protein CcmD [Gammaproteobacteria bacterium]